VINGRTILLRPETRANLAAFGRELPASDFATLFGQDPLGIAAFSDYAGDRPESRYEVFVTYLADYHRLGSLLERLQALHQEADWRTIDYKGRKDRVKARVRDRWLAAFRDHPGLCVALCWDKRSLDLPQTQADTAVIRRDLLPFGVSTEVGQRMCRAFSYLAVIGHLLRQEDRLLWVSDEDAILRGRAGKELPTALAAIANQMIGHDLALFNYCGPLEPGHRVLLTLPDLIAGALAATLGDTVEGHLSPRDSETTAILSALADFGDHTDPTATGARLLVIRFTLDAMSGVVSPCAMRFSRTAQR